MSRIQIKELDEIIGTPFTVLDKGFVRLIDYMGTDSSILQSARVSYGQGTKQLRQDKALIHYLLRHDHTSPFEMCEIKFHVKLPIFVARQWVRHRTANVNEYSARYSVLKDDFYQPTEISLQSEENKQSRGENISNQESLDQISASFEEETRASYKLYSERLGKGIAREIARINLPVSCYTEWYWKIDLHNLMHFLKLRLDHNAQYEIRKYAEVIFDVMKKWVPITAEAFVEHSLNACKLSATSVSIIKSMLKGQKVSQEESGLSKREWKELMETFDLE